MWRWKIVAATAAAVLGVATLAAQLAAAGGAGKTSVRISFQGRASGRKSRSRRWDVHDPLGWGRAWWRSLVLIYFGGSGTTPLGQPYDHVKGYLTLTGKTGVLVIQTKGLKFGSSGEDVHTGRDVRTGTWKISEGSGSYAGATAAAVTRALLVLK